MEFEENREKSMFIHQYLCKKCKNRWWGASANNKCRSCDQETEKLDLSKMVGIGWFECTCGRRYAGFSRGDVTSKCHSCQRENYPSFIVPGDQASGKGANSHYCASCKGNGHCPIVGQVRNLSSKKRF